MRMGGWVRMGVGWGWGFDEDGGLGEDGGW